jgi:hypothetical protein
MKPTRRAMALAHGLLATAGRVRSEDDPSILGGSWAVAPASKT